MIKVLFLHGFSGSPKGPKATALRRESDFDVRAPHLDFLSNAAATAQEEVDRFQPDVIVGSSLGGATALHVRSEAGRVLIAPATRFVISGIAVPTGPSVRRIPSRSVILHAGKDHLVPFANSLQLLESATRQAGTAEAATVNRIERDLRAAGYATQYSRLVRIGSDHKCNQPDPNDTWNTDPSPLEAMGRAVRILATMTPGSG